MSGVERTRVDTERNFLDVLDRVHLVNAANVDNTHIFPLSQIYEGLLLKMGEKGNDGGQFFTPREVIRAMVETIKPQIGETVYDPCCGTGGFLAQSFEYMLARAGDDLSPDDRERLKHRTFFVQVKRKLLNDFFRLLPQRAASERSWTVNRADLEAKNYDLKAVNPNARTNEDTRTPDELLDIIEAKSREVAEALAALRQ